MNDAEQLARFWHFAWEQAEAALVEDDLTGDSCRYSPSFLALLGFAPGDWADSPREQLQRIHPDDLARVLEARETLQNAAAAADPLRIDYRLRHRDGDWRWIRESRQVVERYPDGRARRVLSGHRDIQAQRQAEADARERDRLDGMTGLLVRDEAVRNLSSLLGQTPRRGDGIAVLVCVIDAFEVLRRDQGPLIADAVLVTVARRLRGRIRDTDLAARLEHERLLVVLNGVRDRENAATVSEALRRHVGRPVATAEGALPIRLRIAMTLAERGENVEDLIRAGDAALQDDAPSSSGRVLLLEDEHGP